MANVSPASASGCPRGQVLVPALGGASSGRPPAAAAVSGMTEYVKESRGGAAASAARTAACASAAPGAAYAGAGAAAKGAAAADLERLGAGEAPAAGGVARLGGVRLGAGAAAAGAASSGGVSSAMTMGESEKWVDVFWWVGGWRVGGRSREGATLKTRRTQSLCHPPYPLLSHSLALHTARTSCLTASTGAVWWRVGVGRRTGGNGTEEKKNARPSVSTLALCGRHALRPPSEPTSPAHATITQSRLRVDDDSGGRRGRTDRAHPPQPDSKRAKPSSLSPCVAAGFLAPAEKKLRMSAACAWERRGGERVWVGGVVTQPARKSRTRRGRGDPLSLSPWAGAARPSWASWEGSGVCMTGGAMGRATLPHTRERKRETSVKGQAFFVLQRGYTCVCAHTQ